jgi:hypothetical protein
MKYLLLKLIIIFIILSACKKEDDTAYNTMINTSVSNGFPLGGTDYLNGFLFARKEIVPSLSITSYSSEAGFSSSTIPMSQFYYLSSIILGVESVGIVKINSSTMKWQGVKSSSQQIYKDLTLVPDYSSGVSWTVSGNSNFSPFNTTVPRGFPVINKTNYLPQIISKSQPLVIHTGYNNYTNTDSIMVGISDESTLIYQYFAGKDSVLTFTAEDLADLSIGSVNHQLIVYAKNFSNIVVNNKRYIFVMQTDLVQFISITQ